MYKRQEINLLKINSNVQERIRHELANNIESILKKCNNQKYKKRHRIHKKHKRTLKSLKNKLIKNNCVIIPADKSRAVVIIQKNEIDQKVNTFLEKNKIEKLNKDPTPQYKKEINDEIENSNIINPKKKKWLTKHKISAPKFNPILKTHKAEKPVRPLNR